MSSSPFPVRYDHLILTTVPQSVKKGFILSCFASSSEFLRLPPGQPHSRLHRPAGGLFPLRGVTDGVHIRGVPSSRSVPSSGFCNLSTACSTTGFAGLFHPAATSRVHPFRGFSRSTAEATRRRSVPPCPCRLRADRLPGCHPPTIGLRGLAPWFDAFCCNRGLAVCSVAPLCGFASSRLRVSRTRLPGSARGVSRLGVRGDVAVVVFAVTPRLQRRP